MNNRIGSRLAVSLASLVALAAFACSGAPPASDIGQGDTKAKDKAPSSAGKTPSGSTPAPTTPGGDTTKPPVTPLEDDNACGKKPDAMTCEDCCFAKAPTAFDAADKAYFDCLCAPTTCATDCAASVCADKENENEPTAACKACLDKNEDSCDAKAGAVCEGSAACKAVDACLATQCDPKEPQGGDQPKP